MFKSSDLKFQKRTLDGVSRTFALTIPQLPDGLRDVVGNAYLLCRIADTIEDEPALSHAQKRYFSDQFIDIVAGMEKPQHFTDELYAKLSISTTSDERKLILNTERVIRITHACTPSQRRAMARCVRIMASGMAEFQEKASLAGLQDLAEFDRYCYTVAGVVGEMLTELFCEYCPDTAREYERLFKLAVSFGQALQMTNILKDVWDDQVRSVCWFPRDVFQRHGFDLSNLSTHHTDWRYIDGLLTLVAITHRHQQNALQYIQLIPRHQSGIRRHCLWGLGMSVLTLQRIFENPTFRSGSEVKISRFTVRSLLAEAESALSSNQALTDLFNRLSSCFDDFYKLQSPIVT